MSKEELIQYFKDHPDDLFITRNILCRKDTIGLRFIDYAITHYFKNHKSQELWKLYKGYADALNYYSKRNFDIYCRRFEIMDGIQIDTSFQVVIGVNIFRSSVGQLNFFRWMFENNVFSHMHDHMSDIKLNYNNWKQESHQGESEFDTENLMLLKSSITKMTLSPR